MVTLFIALVAASGGFSAAYWAADLGVGWSVFFGAVAFAAVQFGVGLAFQRRVKSEMERIQGILEAGQRKLQQKIQRKRWQMDSIGSMQAAQREMMGDMRDSVKEALAETEKLLRFRPWVMMLDRQVAMAQLQLNWMIRDFEKVDELLPKALMLDPSTVAIKLARQQMRGDDLKEMEKTYLKGVRRLRYNQNVLLAATWSWILVKRGNVDGAFKALTEALKHSDDATLKRNHECLMNNRVAHFSNSGIGDQWYALYLEEPRTRTQRQHVVRR